MFALSTPDARSSATKFRALNQGLDATEDEEVSADQIVGVRSKLHADAVPYAGFAVFRPYGQRLARKLRFTSMTHDPLSGTINKKELPGPPNFEEWRRSYRV